MPPAAPTTASSRCCAARSRSSTSPATTCRGPVVHRETQDEAQAFWFGAVADGKVDPLHFSARLTGSFMPEASGEHRVGVYRGRASPGSSSTASWSPTRGPTGSQGPHLLRGRLRRGRRHDRPRGRPRLRGGDRVRHQAVRAPSGFAAFARRHRPAARRRGDRRGGRSCARGRDGAGLRRPQRRVGHRGQRPRSTSRCPAARTSWSRAVAAANPRTVVVLQTGGPVEMPWLDEVAAVLAGLVSGAGGRQRHRRRADRRGRARRPPAAELPGRAGPTIRPQSRTARSIPAVDGKVRYEEGVFIGYRHYDRHGIAPLFPFGFGLGYTSFELIGSRG